MTRLLIVAAYKRQYVGHVAPFVREQVEALEQQGVEVRYLLVRGGWRGYAKGYVALRRAIASYNPDVVHAHFGLCGLMANIQRRVPVVTTYHGSDINNRATRLLSRLAVRLSAWNIFVSHATMCRVPKVTNATLLPCGVELTDNQLTGRAQARAQLGIEPSAQWILFAGAFDNAVKCPQLAHEAVALLDGAELHELKGYTRAEVTLRMCAASALLLTSRSEGSPQVVKEAMACGCPVVSVAVGDVAERIAGLEGCYIAERNAADIAAKLRKAMLAERTAGRERLVADGLSNEEVAQRLQTIYEMVER